MIFPRVHYTAKTTYNRENFLKSPAKKNFTHCSTLINRVTQVTPGTYRPASVNIEVISRLIYEICTLTGHAVSQRRMRSCYAVAYEPPTLISFKSSLKVPCQLSRDNWKPAVCDSLRLHLSQPYPYPPPPTYPVCTLLALCSLLHMVLRIYATYLSFQPTALYPLFLVVVNTRLHSRVIPIFFS